MVSPRCQEHGLPFLPSSKMVFFFSNKSRFIKQSNLLSRAPWSTCCLLLSFRQICQLWQVLCIFSKNILFFHFLECFILFCPKIALKRMSKSKTFFFPLKKNVKSQNILFLPIKECIFKVTIYEHFAPNFAPVKIIFWTKMSLCSTCISGIFHQF